MKQTFFYCFILMSIVLQEVTAQESKTIEIRKAGGSVQDQDQFPGANILFKSADQRVHLFHEGALIISDRAYFYQKKNFFKAQGNIVFTQGDSLRMTCDAIEYNGYTKIAKAQGDVFVERPDMTLRTDMLRINRRENKAYYNTRGVIVDSTSTLSSNRGIYFLSEKKYRFLSNVNIVNPNYTVNSEQLDYFTALNQAYLYGRSEIIGKEYEIFCELGFYDTEKERGFFKKNAAILYDNKIINGDSLYFESERKYAAATNNISIIDTINNSIIQGHYGEIFKAKDSAIITKRAVAVNLMEKDSMFVHADTLIATGPENKRVLRGFYDVRIFKTDIQGKSDSLYLDQSTGLIKLLKQPLTKRELRVLTEADKNKRNPILWFGESQVTGDEIFLISNSKTKKLDSLKISGNVFIIEKDTLSTDGFNQIQGGILHGVFKKGKLNNIDIKKNTQVVYYLYSNEDQQLIGIDKTICSALMVELTADNKISNITFSVSPKGNVFPESDLPDNERRLRGFAWRGDERPETVDDLFSEEDRAMSLPAIREFQPSSETVSTTLKPEKQ